MRRAVLPLLVVGLAACGTTEPDEIIYLDVRLADPVLTAGADTRVTVRIGNDGAEDVVLTFGACESLTFIVTDPAGAQVFPPPETTAPTCAEDPGIGRVQPGIVVSVTHDWAAVHDYGTADGPGAPLAPGVYRVTPLAWTGELPAPSTTTGEAAELTLTAP